MANNKVRGRKKSRSEQNEQARPPRKKRSTKTESATASASRSAYSSSAKERSKTRKAGSRETTSSSITTTRKPRSSRELIESDREPLKPAVVDSDKLKVLSIDIGGTKAKILMSGELEPRKVRSGRDFTPILLVEQVRELTSDWNYDVISIGFPGLVGASGPLAEPGNLGSGWMGFDYPAAFGKPVKFVNDAAMQAVGSYEGGRMIFIGLGTGVGSALILDHNIIALEIGNLRFDSRRSVGEVLSKKAIKKVGLRQWRKAVHDLVVSLIHVFNVDYAVVGGGNAKLVKQLPAGARLGHNQTAFLGGFRMWGIDEYNPNPEDKELPGVWSLL